MPRDERILNDQTAKTRLLAKIDVKAADDCWTWLGCIGDGGYGHLRIGGKRGIIVGAHIVAYVLNHGVLDGRHVLHTCDFPLCCNPAHLYPGDHLANMEDMANKARNRVPRPGNGVTKISDQAILEIVHRYIGGDNKSAIARDFGVTPTRVRQILHKQGYR